VPSAQIHHPRADLSSLGEKSRSRPETFRDCVVINVVGFLTDCGFGRGRSYALFPHWRGSTSKRRRQ
jgi:hypothetical protein